MANNSMEELKKALSQGERGRAAAVRGTASNNIHLLYPSPGLRPSSPVGRGLFIFVMEMFHSLMEP